MMRLAGAGLQSLAIWVLGYFKRYVPFPEETSWEGVAIKMVYYMIAGC